jgi:hypothetical protein
MVHLWHASARLFCTMHGALLARWCRLSYSAWCTTIGMLVPSFLQCMVHFCHLGTVFLTIHAVRNNALLAHWCPSVLQCIVHFRWVGACQTCQCVARVTCWCPLFLQCLVHFWHIGGHRSNNALCIDGTLISLVHAAHTSGTLWCLSDFQCMVALLEYFWRVHGALVARQSCL